MTGADGASAPMARPIDQLWPLVVAAGWYITRREGNGWAFGHVGEGDYGDGRTQEQARYEAIAAWRARQR